MAVVYEAIDTATAKRVAFKRLQVAPRREDRQRNLSLFEREYHTLAQLAHPRVVEVYDFGFDCDGAYYTMELLEGRDVQQAGRMPWRTACAVARDVCSALSLLHSRRLVHRDVSPRNVHCTPDARAKLIDFGAVAAMGPSKLLVGTPPCCAPESLHLQALDGRTDLYSLGATLYFMLVGEHAFPARQFIGLQEAWQVGFVRPSEFVPEIPDGLDALVVDLLRLEPDARPANAAEVLQRLAAIDGGAASDELGVAQAYLSIPSLIGRNEALARVSRRFRRLGQRRGRSVLVEGAAGVGRSRFLDACLLDATLLGAAILRADGEDAVNGDYGVVRVLARQLLTIMPQLAREAAAPFMGWLGHVLPELLPGQGNSGTHALTTEPAGLRPQLQRALCDWLFELSRRHPLVIAVDDIHLSDEPSAALLALLTAEAATQAVCVIVSAPSDAAWTTPAAHKALLEVTTRIVLEPLGEEQSRELLQSLFGAVPNLELLAHRAFGVCAGNPRDLMRLSEHLLDRGVVRYEAGAFALPAQIDATDLPSSWADALQARVASLSLAARELASALALCPDQRFGFGECADLNRANDRGGVLGELDELIRADVVRVLADHVGLSKPLWIAPLLTLCPDELRRRLHARLAEVFRGREVEPFLEARHWALAGEYKRLLDVIIPYCRAEIERTSGLTRTMRHKQTYGWREVYAIALRACDELDYPKADKFLLQSRVVSLNSVFGIHELGLVSQVLDQLVQESGLADWPATDPTLEPVERIQAALRIAKQRHLSTPEKGRVLEPAAAIRALATAVFNAMGVVVSALDLAYLEALPDLEPLVPISPAVQVIARLADAMRARLSGRFARAVDIYRDVLAQIERPDRSGLTLVQGRYFRLGILNVLATHAAGGGLAEGPEWVSELEQDPVFELNAVIVRRLQALVQGDLAGAELNRKKLDRLRIQTTQNVMNEGLHLSWEVNAHAISEDLTRLREALDAIAPLAERYPAWRPALHYATAEYHRVRHAAPKALREVEAGLALAPPGRHALWAQLAGSHVLVLLDLGHAPEALERALAYTSTALQLGPIDERLELARCLALARAGKPEAAAATDAVIERLRAAHVAGLPLGAAHETRVHVAVALGDNDGIVQHLEACRAAYCAHRHPALTAKYQRLQLAARRSQRASLRPSASPEALTSFATPSRVSAALEACKDELQRAHLALTLLVAHSGAFAGFLFKVGDDGAVCAAQVGKLALSAELSDRVSEFLRDECKAAGTTCTATGAGADEEEQLGWEDGMGQRYRPVLLSHHLDGDPLVTGVALLAIAPNTRFNYPGQVASEVSRAWAHFGDIVLTTPQR